MGAFTGSWPTEPVGFFVCRVGWIDACGEEREMSKKLFVGGLAWATDDAGLRTAFEQFGEVTEAKVITDRDTGRSRGFGFVTYAEAADADSAIEQMNGASLDGRTPTVDVARERSRDRGGRGGGGRRGGGRGPRW